MTMQLLSGSNSNNNSFSDSMIKEDFDRYVGPKRHIYLFN